MSLSERGVMGPADKRMRVLKRLLVVLSVFSAGVALEQPRPAAFPGFDDRVARATSETEEHYALPITPPLDQGDSDLCWVFAALSMLETDYLARHPGSDIELSRGAVQLESIEDRFARHIRGEPDKLEDGGLAIEALHLIGQRGVVARSDFHGVVDSDPIFSSIEKKLSRAAGPEDKLKVVKSELKSSVGETPEVTHLDGHTLSPDALAGAMVGGHEWVEYDLSRDGAEGFGPSKDPDARPDTRVNYVSRDRLIELIHQSLARSRAVVAGTPDHAFVIYGADYASDGRPLSYLIKDSLAPFLYRESAEELHHDLNDVTVAQ